MSREEFVFSKRAIVVVSVISVIASNVLIGATAVLWLWGFSDELKKTTVEAATSAAVVATEAVIRPLREAHLDHKSRDEEAQKRMDSEIEAIKARQWRFEDRLNQIKR